MSARHVPASCDLLHCRDEDVTEAKVPSDVQREAIELLGIGSGRRLERLTLAQWQTVDRVAAVLATRGTA